MQMNAVRKSVCVRVYVCVLRVTSAAGGERTDCDIREKEREQE